MLRAIHFLRLGALMQQVRVHLLVESAHTLTGWCNATDDPPVPKVTAKPGESIVVTMERRHEKEKEVLAVLLPAFRDHMPMLRDLEEECVKLDLKASVVSVRALLKLLVDDKARLYDIHKETDILASRLGDELFMTPCFMVAVADLPLVEGKNLFGEEVAKQFPGAAVDIEEAGRCLGCDCATACVFHLMRVMEVGLRALAKSLNDPRIDPKTNPSWHSILKKGDDELKKPLAERAPEWAADEPFFSGAHATLRAVQYAWRNPTMHVEINYDKPKAHDVMHCVGGFMRHLATRLQQLPSDASASDA